MASIKTIYAVHPIGYSESKQWLLFKHYAKRMPSISYAFGLYRQNSLEGVLTIGKPASPSLCVGVCGEKFSNFVYELNRLIINEGHPKNVLSFFVSQCLKTIKESKIIVSYADTGQGHTGYIYQATNWLYTGKTVERTDIATGIGKHSRHYEKGADYSQNRTIRHSKHRYIFFTGNKSKIFRSALRYSILPYPKGDNVRYDATFQPVTQQLLFF